LKLPLCLLIFSLSFAFAKTSHKAKAPKAFPSKVHLEKVASCNVKDPAKMVWVFKQWHLAPKTVTKGFKEKYAQEKNQTAIYHVLEEGVKRGEFDFIESEGCEGEINADFTPTFNGWDYTSLKAQAFQKAYDKILTLVPLKIEAKYGEKIATFCGDNLAQIQEGLEKSSNLRGWMGFYIRLNEFKDNPEKLKLYTDSAAELLKISKDTPRDKMLMQIKERIKDELTAFRNSLYARNDSFVKVLQEHDFKHAAVVIGGLHAADLRDKLEKAGLGCEVYEPPGYQPEDEKLVDDFQKAVN
jgi:hypothetical protein